MLTRWQLDPRKGREDTRDLCRQPPGDVGWYRGGRYSAGGRRGAGCSGVLRKWCVPPNKKSPPPFEADMTRMAWCTNATELFEQAIGEASWDLHPFQLNSSDLIQGHRRGSEI